jgi:hypothetical protein
VMLKLRDATIAGWEALRRAAEVEEEQGERDREALLWEEELERREREARWRERRAVRRWFGQGFGRTVDS